MDTVYEELYFSLESLNYNQKEIKAKIDLITKKIGIAHLLYFNPYTLSGGEKQLVLFAIALIKEPKILILDEAMTMLDPANKLKIYDLLLELKDNTTVINICHDLEDALNGEEIIILNNGAVVAEGKTERVLSNIKNLKKIGIEPPFMLELSDKLKYYELITKPIYSIEKMVDKIWP
jgi:energy-coupling factor transport system ATP-binding protein